MDGKGHLTIKVQRMNNIEIECRSCHERVSGDFIELIVRDTGSGIKPEQLDRIFDPFYTTKGVGKGSGMGLSMVHGIVHDHRGHIMVETKPDESTTFTLLFPAIELEVKNVNKDDSDTNIRTIQNLNGDILVIDDDVSVGKFICELLESYGCRVTVETNSQSALLRFKQNPEAFDLVVTDQTMPLVEKLLNIDLLKDQYTKTI